MRLDSRDIAMALVCLSLYAAVGWVLRLGASLWWPEIIPSEPAGLIGGALAGAVIAGLLWGCRRPDDAPY